MLHLLVQALLERLLRVAVARLIGELDEQVPAGVVGELGREQRVDVVQRLVVAVEDDVLDSLGLALLEASQGRQPCWKLNLRFDVPDMARRVQESGRSGWYFRVIEPGMVAAGDRGVLVERPHPAWSLARVSHLLYHDRMNRPALAELAGLPGLTESWKRLAEARLASGRTEDWSRRIETPRG